MVEPPRSGKLGIVRSTNRVDSTAPTGILSPTCHISLVLSRYFQLRGEADATEATGNYIIVQSVGEGMREEKNKGAYRYAQSSIRTCSEAHREYTSLVHPKWLLIASGQLMKDQSSAKSSAAISSSKKAGRSHQASPSASIVVHTTEQEVIAQTPILYCSLRAGDQRILQTYLDNQGGGRKPDSLHWHPGDAWPWRSVTRYRK
jgi:hypothetical protein